MKKSLVFLACAVFALGLTLGCGGGGDEQAAEQAPPAEQAAQDGAAVAVHDCAGPCGMKDVPEDQLMQVDGKWYCAGCVDKARADHDHDHADHDHK